MSTLWVGLSHRLPADGSRPGLGRLLGGKVLPVRREARAQQSRGVAKALQRGAEGVHGQPGRIEAYLETSVLRIYLYRKHAAHAPE